MRARRFCLAALLALPALAARAGAPAAEEQKLWWERGAITWYYKDDWKGQALLGSRAYTRTIEVPGGAAGGWIYVWGGNGYSLALNGKDVGDCADSGLIDTYDLAKFLAGRPEKVELRIGGGSVCAEGEAVAADGRRIPFVTDESWRTADGKPPRTRPMVAGPSSGAFHRAHNARIGDIDVGLLSEEERGKIGIAGGLGRIQRLNDQGLYLMRRLRPAAEILSFDAAAPWRAAERAALPLAEKARGILAGEATAAQKAGRFADALAACERAAVLLSAAEAPVTAATDLYRAGREATHIANLWHMLNLSLELYPGVNGPLQIALNDARRAHADCDWAAVSRALSRFWAAAAEVRACFEAAATKTGKRIIEGLGNLDEFPEDRFGWLNARDLMGNDPAGWPFIVAPSECPYLDIGGLWDFRLDPDNEGEKAGWHTDKAPAEGWKRIAAGKPWERQGYQQDNLKSPADAPYKPGDARCFDKPYNGFAWYRKRIFIPAAWKDKKVMITVGDVTNWSRVFVNGKPLGGGRQGTPPPQEIPASLPEFGRENLIAIQVYNHDNFGGIAAGHLALYLDGSHPELRETPMPLGYAKEHFFQTAGGRVDYAIVTSAMSPATVVSSKGGVLEFRGWEARGYALPSAVRLKGNPLQIPGALGHHAVGKALDSVAQRVLGWGPSSKNGIETGRLSGPIDVPLADGWWVLTGGQNDVMILLGTSSSPPVVSWKRNALGGMSLALKQEVGPIRVGILVMPPGIRLDDDACGFWDESMGRYPVAASHILTAASAKGNGAEREFSIHYDYYTFRGSGHDVMTLRAPVPMLASYGLEHHFPGLSVEGAKPTGYRSTHAPHLVVGVNGTLNYRAPAVDRSKVMKGVGELFHGQPQEVYDRMASWGFDHVQYAWAFQAPWDLPLVRYVGGPLIEDNEATWKKLDAEVDKCNRAGMQMMLTWFFNEDTPQKDTGGAVRNSTRYWRAHPEAEKNAFELWRRIAQRYKDKPDWAISYDFFNEPAYINTDHWKGIMKDLTRIIRSVDTRHTIVWESADGWAQPQWSGWMEPVNDDRVLYSFHHYGKHWGYAYDEYYPGYRATTEAKQIDPWLEAILFSIRHNVPIHCGEFGISMIQPAGNGEQWLNDYLALFERFGIGWNWWNYSGRDIYRTGLAAGDRTSPYVPVLTKWCERSGWGASRRAAKEK